MIAAVVDDRPMHMRRKDIDRNRWRTIETNTEEENDSGKKSEFILEISSSKDKKKRRETESDLSPPRSKNLKNNSDKREDNKSDNDLSPPRTNQKDSATKRQRHDSDSDLSPAREPKREVDSRRQSKSGPQTERDLSPQRHRSKDNKRSESTSRRRHDSDLSPPRNDSTAKRTRHDSDSDLSPVRQIKYENRSASRTRNDRDLSPPRNRPPSSTIGESSTRRRHDSDSDLSPPRPQSSNHEKTDKKRETTLSGKRAGLSEAKYLKEELIATKKREEKLFATISDEMLGKNAKTVFRDSKSGRIRNLEEEAKAKLEKDLVKDKIEAEKKAKYEKWSRGLTQTQEKQEKRESDLHEMSKPLARYEDDTDMDKMLREKEREDDPMLQAIRQSRTKKKIEEEGLTVKPEYKGPPPPMNRFGIKPGYRWDGVDRSNGFEKKYFERISSKEAIQEEAYKWSTQDM